MQEMQEAGYILLMPGGDWNADTTYHILHLVNHNGASWLCKVEECTGQEPSDSNTEFWQRFGTAVDLSNYLPKSGGTVNGDITVLSDEAVNKAMNVKNSLRSVGVRVFSNGSMEFYDYTNGKNIFSSKLNGASTFNGHASEDLSLTGGEVIIAGLSSFALTRNGAYMSGIAYKNTNGLLGYIGVDKDGNPVFRDSNETNKTLLHTGNKPTGTYTGNGDATERTIATNGIGDVVMVFNNTKGFAIITKSGAVCIDTSGNVSVLATTEAKFNGGIITLATTNAVLNALGTNHNYQVL